MRRLLKNIALRITVFGATGQAGRCITRFLLNDPSCEVTGCSRSDTRLRQLTSSLAGSPGSLQTQVVDVASEAHVLEAMSSADVVVGATSQSADGPVLADLAVRCGTSYLGIHLSSETKWAKLRSMQEACVEKGVMVVDDAGAHPGLPAAMVRYAALDGPLRSAWVGGKFALPWNDLDVTPATIADFVDEIESMQPAVFKNGKKVRGYRHARAFDFEIGRGAETCTPMFLEEIGELAQSGTVASTGFFIGGFGRLVDYGIFPLSMGLVKLNRRWASQVMWWGLRRLASEAPYGVLLLDAERASDGSPVRLRVSHADPYVLTAAPAVATIRQMLSHPKPGVWTQAGFVEPQSFFESLQEWGIKVDA